MRDTIVTEIKEQPPLPEAWEIALKVRKLEEDIAMSMEAETMLRISREEAEQEVARLQEECPHPEGSIQIEPEGTRYLRRCGACKKINP